MKSIILLSLLLITIPVFSQKGGYSEKEMAKIATQKQIATEIQKEGLMLYRLEAASWYGTDLFLKEFPGDQSKIGGYFSYEDGPSTKCIFFSGSENPKVIGTITFGKTVTPVAGTTDINVRPFTSREIAYMELRGKAFDYIKSDTSIRQYSQTGFNVVPIIQGSSKRVYIMTSTSREGMMLMGNDYLLQYDPQNNLQSTKALHSSLITMKYPSDGENTTGNIHTHLPEYSPFITPTDICIAKLYESVTGWHNYTTVSKDYISVWTGENLYIIPIDKVRSGGK